MNEQHFAAIQERWLAASGGPWTIQGPWKHPDETNLDKAEAAIGEPIKSPARISIENFDEWECQAMEHLRFVYAVPPKTLEGLRKLVDKSIIRDTDGPDEPEPAFWVGRRTAAADVVLVANAVKDIGDLLHAVEAQHRKIEELRAAVAVCRSAEAASTQRAEAADRAIAQLRGAVAAVQKALP